MNEKEYEKEKLQYIRREKKKKAKEDILYSGIAVLICLSICGIVRLTQYDFSSLGDLVGLFVGFGFFSFLAFAYSIYRFFTD